MYDINKEGSERKHADIEKHIQRNIKKRRRRRKKKKYRDCGLENSEVVNDVHKAENREVKRDG